MENRRTSLSAGIAIRAMLLNDPEVRRFTSIVAPILVPAETPLPYIVYKRTSLGYQPVKSGYGSDNAFVEVLCIAGSYAESIDMAEAVRRALDGRMCTMPDGYTLRRITFEGSDEDIDGNASIQSLSFQISV